MKEKQSLSIYRIYSILLSASLIVTGICFIAACLYIYYSGGDETYSREIVADTFSYIAIPVYVSIALSLLGFIFEFSFLKQVPKAKITKSYENTLNLMLKKKDISTCDESLFSSIIKEEKTRRMHVIIRSVLLFCGGLIFMLYALNQNNWPIAANINSAMIRAMWVLIPCIGIPFAYAVYTVFCNSKSLQKEIELVKQIPGSKKTGNTQADAPSEKKCNIFTYVFLIISIGILTYGIITGGTLDVLTKAVNICTECIGLG